MADLKIKGSDSGHKIILVKHSLPLIQPEKPPYEWHLSKAGRRRGESLARRLMIYQPAKIVASNEPKAMETAAIIAGHFNTDFETIRGLHEHRRGKEDFVDSQERFNHLIKNFFTSPDKRVFGQETANQALKRFSMSIRQVLQSINKNVIIVAHGTVITLFVSQYNQIDPFAFWLRLSLPSFVVLSLPDFKCELVLETSLD